MGNQIDIIKELLERFSAEGAMHWSDWHSYCGNVSVLESLIPDLPGIYEFKVSGLMFGRLNGATDVVYIGRTGRSSKAVGGSLRKRICFRDHTGSMKWLKAKGHTFDVRWMPLHSDDAAEVAEQWNIKKYIKKHFESPPGQRGEGGTDPESCGNIKIKRGDKTLVWANQNNLMDTLESAKVLLENVVS